MTQNMDAALFCRRSRNAGMKWNGAETKEKLPLRLLVRILKDMAPQIPSDGQLYPDEATGQRVLRLITPIEAVLSALVGSDLRHNSHAMYALALALAIRLQRLPLPERRALGEGALALIRVSAFGPYSDDDEDDDELDPDDEAPYG